MDYQSAICSTEKVVKQLPEILRKSFYKATKDVSFVSGDVTLIKFERWLENRLKEYFNSITNIIAKEEEKPKVPPYKVNTGTIYRKFTDKQIVCWSCNQPYILMECEKFIKKKLQERKEFVSNNKLC